MNEGTEDWTYLGTSRRFVFSPTQCTPESLQDDGPFSSNIPTKSPDSAPFLHYDQQTITKPEYRAAYLRAEVFDD